MCNLFLQFTEIKFFSAELFLKSVVKAKSIESLLNLLNNKLEGIGKNVSTEQNLLIDSALEKAILDISLKSEKTNEEVNSTVSNQKNKLTKSFEAKAKIKEKAERENKDLSR